MVEAPVALMQDGVLAPVESAVVPPGSLISGSLIQSDFATEGETDSFTLSADARQKLTVVLQPTDPSIRGHIEIVDPLGIILATATAESTGAVLLLDNVPLNSVEGDYRLTFTGVEGAGNYDAMVWLNTAIETEQFGRVANDEIESATDLNSSSIDLEEDATRLAILGQTETVAPDFFSFTLEAGQVTDVGLFAFNLDASLTLDLFDESGTIVANGRSDSQNVSRYVSSLIAPVTTTYYMRVAGVGGEQYALMLTRGAEFDRESNATTAPAQDISVSGQVLGALGYPAEVAAGVDSQDHYLIRSNAGDVLTITTSTPGGTVNTLNPKIELYTETGTEVLASDLDSVGDGRNAQIANFTMTATGVYRLVVSAESGTGDYILHVAGATGSPVPFTIVSQSVQNGELWTTYPTTFLADLSEPLNLASVQASDLQIQGPDGMQVSADSVTIIDHDTVEFGIASAHTSDGLYTLTIPAGAFTSLTNKPLQTALTSTFDLDATPPRVFNTNLTDGATVSPDGNGNLTVTIEFTEPMETIGLDAADVMLRDMSTNGINTPATFTYEAGSNTLTITYDNIPDSAYALTLLSSATGFRDLCGHLLDGDADGVAGGDWVRSFIVDAETRAYTAALQPLVPAGGLIYTDFVPTSTRGLVSWWQGEGDAGDSAGSNHGTLHGGTTFVDGQIEQAFQLDGVDDYINIPDPVMLDSLTTEATISLWIKPDLPMGESKLGYLFYRYDPSWGQGLGLAVNIAGAVAFVVGTTNGNSTLYTAQGTVAFGEFAHIAATVDTATGQTHIYVNGVEVPYTTVRGPETVSGTLLNADHLSLGRRYGGGVVDDAYFKGLMDDVRLYNRALTATEVAAQAGHLPVEGRFHAVGDIDAYTLNVDAGQTLSMVLKPGDATVQGLIKILDPNGALIGSATSEAAGAVSFLQTVPTVLSGVYTIQVASQAGTGAYALATTLNATVEPETFGGAANNDLGSAIDLMPSAVTLQGSAVRLAAIGQTEPGTPDVYLFELAAGQTATIVVTTTDGSGVLDTLELLDAAGTVLASGVADGATIDRAIRDFVAPVTGPYYVRVGAGSPRAYSVVVTLQAEFERESDGSAVTAQDLGVTGQVLGSVGFGTATIDQVDQYRVEAVAGELWLMTTTPGGDAGEPNNTVVPKLELYDESDLLVASNQGGAPDGRNAQIAYEVSSESKGTYRVAVSALSGVGAYTLAATGSAVVAHHVGPTVVAITPADGARLASPPTTIDLTFSEGLRLDSVDASDLQLSGGGTVITVQVLDGQTLRFTVSVPDVPNTETTYTVTLPAGAVTDLQGDPNALYTSTFVVDHVGPRIVAQTPATQASSPWTSLTVTFDEPINAATFTATDAVMTGPNGPIPISAIMGSGTTVTLMFAPQTTAGTYTFTIGPTVTDLVGNLMDQNDNGINGEAGQADAYQSTVLLQAPDLLVSNVTTDLSAAQFGQPITVTWTVENAGADPARESWSDQLWLSTNQTLEPGTDIRMGDAIPSGLTGPLDPLATYQQTATVTLPLMTALSAGTYYILVETDSGKTQLETNETDNHGASAALTLTVPPVPDLVVTAITAPSTAQPGQTILLTWTVSNQGSAAATGTWTDYVYLSSDASIGADRYVASFTFTGTLDANASVERTQNVTLPTDLTGMPRLVIQTDAGISHIYEHDQETNNTAIDDVVVTIVAPDLQVSNIQLPAEAFSGQPITVTWTVTNNGTADFTGTVVDRLALSNNATIGSDSFVRDVPWTGTLAIGASVQRSHTVTLDRNLSGLRWAVVTTDILGQVPEYPNDDNNTAISAQPTNIALQFSDLVVDAVSAPSTAQSGEAITVSWRVRNQGALSTNLSAWTDRLVLAAGETLGTTFHILRSVGHTGRLDPEGTYTGHATVTLPNGIAGAYHVFVQTDYVDASTNGVLFEATGEGNNVGRTVTPLDITLAPYPDLLVTSVTGPTTVQPGQTVTVAWTVANSGTGSSTASRVDQVYLSADGTTTGAAYVGQVTMPAGTEPGSSEAASLTGMIPAWVPDGTYRWLIVSDAGGVIYEGPTGGDLNNTGLSDVVQVTHPDLRAMILSAPTSAASGATVQVAFEVTNAGSGPAQGTWTDKIYLSTDGTVDTNDVVRGTLLHTGPVAAGASYTGEFDMVIPLDKSGPWMLLLKTDADAQVAETSVGNAEGNNVASSPIDVTLSPYADLAVSDVTVDPLVIGDPGQVTVGWTVTNTTAGTGTGVTDTWTDAVIASTDTVLGNSDDRVLATFVHAGLLNVGDQYSQVQTFYLPAGFAGRYHLFVQTDSTGAVFEHANEANNSDEAGHVLDAMRIPYADLQVDAITIPATAETGSPMRVSWTVSNHGIGLTNVTAWSDRVMLASDAAGQQLIYDYGLFKHSGPLQPNGSYDRAVDLVLPQTLSGPVYVVVQAGSSGNVFEFLYNTNNRRVSDTTTIVSLRDTPDLRVTALNGPATVFEGGAIDLTWTVRNDGAAEATSSWRDHVVLRRVGDASGAGTIPVGDFVYDRGLLAGQSYTRTESFTLPSFIQGEYQLEVTTDSQDALFERTVGTGTGETNNTTHDAAFMTVQLRPRPDLRVSSVTAPATVEAGGSVSLEFTVLNDGTAATPSLWMDRAYLSLDKGITPDDILIGTFDNVAALDPGQGYTQVTGSIQVPIRYRGDVFLLIKPDSGSQVEEFPYEGNNLYAQPLYVEPLPLADLVTGSVVAPDQVLPGTQVEVRYRVE
ncbi:MAG: Ig-like domain-containing protein, partial [Nitrospira sp.]|nr:Ig-like domain-containing protein [Nitrospira sp.]